MLMLMLRLGMGFGAGASNGDEWAEVGAETCRIGEFGRRERVAEVLVRDIGVDRKDELEDEHGEEELRCGCKLL